MKFSITGSSCEFSKASNILNIHRTRKPMSTDMILVQGVNSLPVNLEEHCQECDAPLCYQNCALYEPEQTIGCRRFEFGILLEKNDNVWTKMHADIVFKRWARLKAKARNVPQFDVWRYGFLLQFDFDCDPSKLIKAHLDISPSPWTPDVPSVRKTLVLNNGYHQVYVPPIELQKLQNYSGAEASLCLVDEANGVFRLFAAHFVEGVVNQFGENLNPIKMICLDLDDTLWNGTLGEANDEPSPVEGISQVLYSLKMRRIAIVALSRSQREKSVSHLEKLGLLKYFDSICCDATSKSEEIKTLCKKFSIFPHEVIFVDNDFYERAEVEALCPEVKVIAETRLMGLANDPLITASLSTSQSKKSYNKITNLSNISLNNFKKQQKPQMKFISPSKEDLIRSWELLQRTNRLHCVEWRPTFAGFVNTLEDKNTICKIGRCFDKSGDYGLVCIGMAKIENLTANVIALTFSCRIAERIFPIYFTEKLQKELLQKAKKIEIVNAPSIYANSSVQKLRSILTNLSN